MPRRLNIALFAVALLLIAAPALAATSQYVTYGGFTTIYPAFKQCAAIFGSSDYSGMLTGIALLGIMISALVTVINQAERATPLAWVFMAFSGIAIFMALFVPKDDLDIYDPVYNQEQVVVGLPVAVVLTAQISNLIEQFAVLCSIRQQGDPLLRRYSQLPQIPPYKTQLKPSTS
jgi:hypothetical protein